MLRKILNTVDAYLMTNKDVLDPKEIAELDAQKAFLYSLIENDNHLEEWNKAEEKAAKLKRLLFKVMKEHESGDVKVTRREFLEVYEEAMDDLASDECECYGNNVTVHWHGIYCDCSDGATAWNHIVSNIKSVNEELDDEDDD